MLLKKNIAQSKPPSMGQNFLKSGRTVKEIKLFICPNSGFINL
jgi:hypothetical protein